MTAAVLVGTTIHDEHVTVVTTLGRSRVLIDGARLSTHRTLAEALQQAHSLVPAHRRADEQPRLTGSVRGA